jgi:hypothetical protein
MVGVVKQGPEKKKFNFPEKMPIYQASPMTPPHPAWVFSETWANLFGRGHEKKADENQGEAGETAPALPALRGWGRLPLPLPGPLAAHTGQEKQNEAQQGQNLPETTFFHTLPMILRHYGSGTRHLQGSLVPARTKKWRRERDSNPRQEFPPALA